MAKNYNTKQKQDIEETILSIKQEHFTCEELSLKLKEKGKNIGLTTVYRHLDKMVKDGFLRKYASLSGESACYQVIENCGEHFHLKCVSCGKLVHLACESLDMINAHVKNEHGFFIDPAKTVFYGTCKECAK